MSLEATYGIQIVAAGLPDDRAQVYRQTTLANLATIESTRVGKLLLRAIAWHARNNPSQLAGGKVTIQPYIGTDCNAAEDNMVKTPTGWSQPIVSYSPDVFARDGACWQQMQHADTNRGLSPDELLFHEMVHAFRGASARFHTGPVHGGLVNYDRTEEFIAVLVTNIYISDPSNKRKTGLRRDHHDFTKLESELAGSLAFFQSSQDAFALIERFCNDNPSFTAWIADVKAPFNPIAAYYKTKEQARRFSNSAVALVRDRDWSGIMNKIMEGLANPMTTRVIPGHPLM